MPRRERLTQHQKICLKWCEMVQNEDIDEFKSNFNVIRLHYLASDLYTLYMRNVVNEIDDAMLNRYLDYHDSVGECPDKVGLSHHSFEQNLLASQNQA